MSFLTDQSQVSGVSLTDLIHVVVTGDTSQNPAGSSFKASIQQVIIAPTNSWGLYAQTGNSVAVSATTVETTILNGGIGSLSIPANGFRVGDSFNARLGGIISSRNNDRLTIRVKADSVVLGTTGAITLPGMTNQVWDFNIGFTIRQIGGTGTASILSHGIFSFVADSSNKYDAQAFNTINNTTFNTTTQTTLEITAQFSSNNASNSITTEYFTLTKIY